MWGNPEDGDLLSNGLDHPLSLPFRNKDLYLGRQFNHITVVRKFGRCCEATPQRLDWKRTSLVNQLKLSDPIQGATAIRPRHGQGRKDVHRTHRTDDRDRMPVIRLMILVELHNGELFCV